MAQTYYTSIRAGAELIQTLSSSLYKNAYYVLDELISNSYDADATKVEVNILKNKLTISDNGVGMDREGLENYLWLGHSEKRNDRRTGKLSRYTIGKFGIGKLSMHVICNRCKIMTRRNGVKSTLLLDFNKILSHKNLSEEQIHVDESSTNQLDGTTIELLGLKQVISKKKAIRRIARNMPLSPEFQVTINKELLKPEDIIKGTDYPIQLDLKLAGKVMGKLIYSDTPLGEFAGIYIKVYGRTVNADDPNILNLTHLVANPGAIARLYCVLHADGLDDIVLATRNGFYEEAPKFIEFRKAICKQIKSVLDIIQISQSKEELSYENNLLEDVLKSQVENMLKGSELPTAFPSRYMKRKDAKRIKKTLKLIEKRRMERAQTQAITAKTIQKQVASRVIKIANKTFTFELESMGKNAYECVLDVDKSTFYINIDHPQYIYSRIEGSLAHHFRRVIIFEIARAISGDSLIEFTNQYESIMQEMNLEEDQLVQGYTN